MSFNSKNHWMPGDADCLTDGKIGLGTSSKEVQKRRHNWDAVEEDLFYVKKQAAESIENRPVTGTANMNMSLWGNSSSSGAGQFNDHHFGPESHRSIGLAGKDISLDTGNLNIQRRGLLDQFEMSHILKNAFGLNGGVGKGDVTPVRNSMNAFSMPMGHPYVIRENNKMPSSATYQAPVNSVPIQPDYGKEDRNAISLGSSSSKVNDNIRLMGQTLSRGSNVRLMGQTLSRGSNIRLMGQTLSRALSRGSNIRLMGQTLSRGSTVKLMGQTLSRGSNFKLMGHQYNRVNDSMLSMDQPFNQGSYGFASFAPQYGAVNSSFMRGGQNFVMMGPEYGKSSENFKSMNPTFDKGDAVITSMNSYQKGYASTMPMHNTFDIGNSSTSSMGQNYNVGESTIISFGLEANSSSGGIIKNSDMLTSQSLVQVTEATPQMESTETNVNQVTKATSSTSKTGAASMNKEKNSNTFPANVKTMLSTGIFDGVPVMYVSWCREHKLRGIIRGGGYLCDCIDCKFSKAINAYEFECHAGGKSKHPNNHIYFENGKTVCDVVLELKSTPPEKLFETIQNVTGSPINQKNFRTWKVSYLAASRELV